MRKLVLIHRLSGEPNLALVACCDDYSTICEGVPTSEHIRSLHDLITLLLFFVMNITRISGTEHSFIHSGYFYNVSSSPLLLRGAPDTARILCRSFTPKRHRQLCVKDLPKVPTWRIERDSNPRSLVDRYRLYQ